MLTNRYTIALLLYTLAWPVQAQVSTPAPFINPESAAPAAEKEAEPVIDNQAERKAAPVAQPKRLSIQSRSYGKHVESSSIWGNNLPYRSVVL